MTAGASRADEQRTQIKTSQIEVGGKIGHLFNFPVTPEVAYDYFSDIPTIFALLPDVQRIIALDESRYRIVVGASDGYGHAMAALFDVEALGSPGKAIYLQPFAGGPAYGGKGLNFHGDLWAEALFSPGANGTSRVNYSVEMAMDIPLPGVFQLMPKNMLRTISDTAISVKMRHMISGFVREVNGNFASWAKNRC